MHRPIWSGGSWASTLGRLWPIIIADLPKTRCISQEYKMPSLWGQKCDDRSTLSPFPSLLKNRIVIIFKVQVRDNQTKIHCTRLLSITSGWMSMYIMLDNQYLFTCPNILVQLLILGLITQQNYCLVLMQKDVYIRKLRVTLSYFRAIWEGRGHRTSPIWLRFGLKSCFRVLTGKWMLKSSNSFFFGKYREGPFRVTLAARHYGGSKQFLLHQ